MVRQIGQGLAALVILPAFAVALAGDPYMLEGEYYAYSGDTTDTIGPPDSAPPLCSGALFNDVSFVLENETQVLSSTVDSLQVQVVGRSNFFVGYFDIDIDGTYEVAGATAGVDIHAFVDLSDNETGSQLSFEIDSAAAGFPIFGDDGTPTLGPFSIATSMALYDIGSPPGFFGRDIDAIIHMTLVARGSAVGPAMIRVTELHLSPRPAFLSAPWPPGDANNDGDVNLSDLPAFVDTLLTGPADCTLTADVNLDGYVDSRDIPDFIDAVMRFSQCNG